MMPRARKTPCGQTRSLTLLCALLCLPLLATAGTPASYPVRPIRIVVPYTPGTGIDILARVVGQQLAGRLKVAVVVDNRPGASGNIGTEAVSKAPADGYVLLMTSSTHVLNAALQPSVPYDPVKGFTPIGPTASASLALVVNPSLPARSVRELVALAKAEPGKLNYASPGNGTPHHLAMELFKRHFDVDITHVPYNGTAGAVTDLIGGQVQVMFLPVHVALPLVQSGRLRMLSAGGAQRSPATPDVPSLADEGVTDIDVDIWYALLGPPGLDREQVALLNAEVNAILREADVADVLGRQGLQPRPGTPADLERMITTDLDRWTRLIRAAKITVD